MIQLTKKSISIFIMIIFVIFVIGYTAGSQHIPFSNSLNLIYTKSISPDIEKYEKIPSIINETIVESLIDIHNVEDVKEKRDQLVDFIWKSDVLPLNKMPTKIIQNIEDHRFSEINNLNTIDKIIINMEYEIDSYPYLFHPKESNNKLLIYHQGHAGDFINGIDTISFFVDKGFTILAFSMPLLGSNNAPILDIDNFGKIKIDSHNKLRFLDSKDFSSIKLFLHPILLSLNYVEKNYEFETFDMIGLSGGAWTITLYSAIDERISKIFPVGGPLPMYITQNSPYGNWEYETSHLSLYNIVNYPDLFIMGSTGKNKEQIKILNKFDNCCYYGLSYTTFEKTIQNSINKLGNGKFIIHLDETHSTHKISENSLDIIQNEIMK